MLPWRKAVLVVQRRWHSMFVRVAGLESFVACLQAALATSLGMTADEVTDTVVNQYITEGASTALGSGISSCMGSATTAEERSSCTGTAAKALLVSSSRHWNVNPDCCCVVKTSQITPMWEASLFVLQASRLPQSLSALTETDVQSFVLDSASDTVAVHCSHR